ncbi:hypothetical protein [Paenibacillus sp. JCM 10914]|uniref:hypothetical protein n=1 Tax=Paenibacillus sp. JCM 10914 TaxID=1236974 RepID=UPI0003CC4821|nr:hypothetical protein [Paenibacillus sp. JCM 10914]GAE05199.1 hypothetical protein JCM10914_1290 [Paenibacillus sp. JCM 10914]
MESTNSKLLYYFIWTLAAGVLLYFGESVLQHYMEKSYKTFEISGTIWVSVIVPFIYGLHMALLDGLPRAFRPNWPLFILVFLPSFLLLMYRS